MNVEIKFTILIEYETCPRTIFNKWGNTVLVTLFRWSMNSTALSNPSIMCPLTSERRGRVQGIRMAFSNIDRKCIEGVDRD